MSNSRLDQIRSVRLQKLDQLKKLGIDPYPPKYDQATLDISEARSKSGEIVSVSGRLMRWREHGQVVFADLKDGTGRIQLLFHEKNLAEKFPLLKLIDAGDFLGATGRVITTNSGEITVDVESFMLLSKSIRPLPDQWAGLTDEESRYRQRYLELLLNPELVDIFRKKALFWQSMRNFMLDRGFMEVETPVLENTAGGADAQPFVTHHNALDTDLYLRISMGELWQKRLMVAGFVKTFEIGRQFRNEGVSREHLQDYTQMEFYMPYVNYYDSMALVEDMYKYLAHMVFGTYDFVINEHKISLNVPWPKIDYTEIVFQKTGLDLKKCSDDDLISYLRKQGVKISLNDGRGKLIDHVFKTFRRELSGPAFLINHPVEVSPLAKRQPENTKFVERYQVILAGTEMGNGYSELNDPIDQAERFVNQQALRDTGDAEAQMNDEDFVTALEYGMPPVSGFGVSERLFSFLANKPIRETVLFPLLRPETSNTKKQDFSQKLVIVIDSGLPAWQIMNTSGHIAAFLGNKMTAAFDTAKHFTTKDGINLPRNTQFPIVTLSATKDDLIKLMPEVRESGLLYIGYVPEMMVTSNDKKLAEMLAGKTESEIVYAGIGLFGPKDKIDELTKKFKLWE